MDHLEDLPGFRRAVDRRRFLQLGAAGAVTAWLAACGGDNSDSGGATTASGTASTTGGGATTATGSGGGASGKLGGGGGDGTIKLGYVSPKTGPLAAFAEADDFIFDGIREAAKDGVRVGDKSYKIEIVAKDSQSDPNRAGEVASSLILDDGIDLMLVGNTPETTNPVADQCEANGMPCISSLAPWQPWFFRSPAADPAKGYEWTYHFFWGLEDIIAVFLGMWGTVTTNKKIGALYPNDGDGNAWGDGQRGFPPAFTAGGYTLVDPGRYPNGTADFSAQIGQFKSQGVEIVTGVPIPPDFTTFWKQALQQGFKPKAASIGKAILFPASVEALGDTANNLSSEVWWSPNHPFTSSLTGVSAKELATAYESKTAKQWTQPIGFAHGLFEVAIDVLNRAGSTDKAKIRDAIPATDLDTIVGTVAWGKDASVPKNVCKTPLVGGQWKKSAGGKHPYDLVIVWNQSHTDIPTGGTFELIA
jgi:branched-chain amino acid transport system substrate-binding protein